MAWFRGHSAAPGASANDIATSSMLNLEGGRVAAIVSVIALVFSAYSLWETSLKQAELGVYVTGVVAYERDLTADEYIRPSGGFEVLAVPVTIANSGARDGVVLALELDVNNPKTGLGARFAATYTADAAYFAATGTQRPRTPFSALVIAGRTAWTGTVLFYPVSYSNGKALTPKRKVDAFNDELREKFASEMDGVSSLSVLREKRPNLPEWAEQDAYEAKVFNQNDKVEVTLKLIGPAPGGWLDSALGKPVQPIPLTLDVPDIPGDRIAKGELVRLRSAVIQP